MVYLDWAATAPPDSAVAQAAVEALDHFANPSSTHPAGRKAREVLETARARLAGALVCEPREIVFTSGGTESNWIALSSLIGRTGGPFRVVSSGIEHPSIHDNLEVLERLGLEVIRVPAAPDGIVDPERVLGAVDGRTVLITIMCVNNVTGAIQPVRAVADAIRERRGGPGRRVHVHTDAVQALGKMPLSLHNLGVDSASLSAHKVGGPRGIGALYLREGAVMAPLARGGDQERGVRPGTENVAGAAAFAAAAVHRTEGWERDRTHAVELDRLLETLLAPLPGYRPVPTARHGSGVSYTPFIRAASFPPIPSEVLVRALGEEGVCVSAGSACASSDRDKRERVYRAMGLPENISGSAIRVSLGPTTTERDIRDLAAALGRVVPRLHRVAAGSAGARARHD